MLSSSMCLYTSLPAMPDLHRCCETPVLTRAEWAVQLELLGWWAVRGGQWGPAGREVYGVQSPSSGMTEVPCSESHGDKELGSSTELKMAQLRGVPTAENTWGEHLMLKQPMHFLLWSHFSNHLLGNLFKYILSCSAVMSCCVSTSFMRNLPIKHQHTFLILCGKLHFKQYLWHCDLRAHELLDTLKPVRASQIHAVTSMFPLMLHGKKNHDWGRVQAASEKPWTGQLLTLVHL